MIIRDKWYDKEERIITKDEDGLQIEEDEFDLEAMKNEHIRELLVYLGFSEEESYAINVYDRVMLNGYLDAVAQTYNDETFEVNRKLELIQVLKVEGFADEILEEYSVVKKLYKDKEVVHRLKGTALIPFRRVVMDVIIVISCLSSLGPLCMAKQWGWAALDVLVILAGIFGLLDELSKYRKSKKLYGNLYKKTYRFKLSNVIFIVGILVLLVLIFIAENSLRQIRAPKGYVFYEMNSLFDLAIYIAGFIYIPMLINYVICKINAKKERITWFSRIVSPDSFSSRHIGKFTCLYLIIFVLCAMSGVFVTEEEIVCFSPINPGGKHYSFDKIDSVKAGFGNKGFSFKEGRTKGEFYYEVNIADKVFRFSDIGIMENVDSDFYTYEALDMVDKAIMSHGVKKHSSVEFKELMEYKEDREICLNIIKRK